MGLSTWVGSQRFEIGDPAFLKAWFSTIFVLLEGESWGARYPVIMRDLYGGRLSHEKASRALKELEDIHGEFAALKPEKVVWDFEERASRPPWGDNISPQITSLANYFVTSDGHELFEVLRRALSQAVEREQDIKIA